MDFQFSNCRKIESRQIHYRHWRWFMRGRSTHCRSRLNFIKIIIYENKFSLEHFKSIKRVSGWSRWEIAKVLITHKTKRVSSNLSSACSDKRTLFQHLLLFWSTRRFALLIYDISSLRICDSCKNQNSNAIFLENLLTLVQSFPRVMSMKIIIHQTHSAPSSGCQESGFRFEFAPLAFGSV